MVVTLSAQLGGEITGDPAQRAGMAGAGMATAGSIFDAPTNPAVLGFQMRGNRKSLQEYAGRLFWGPVSIESTDGDLYRPDGVIGGGPWIGVANRVSPEFAWSFSLVPVGGGSANYDRMTELNVATVDPNDPLSGPALHSVEMSTNMIQLALAPSFAWTPQRNLSFGFGASVRYTKLDFLSATDIALEDLTGDATSLGFPTYGDLLDFLFNQQAGRGIEAIQADISAEAEAAFHSFAHFGVMFAPTRDSRLSAWYRTPSTSKSLDGSVDVDVEADIGEINALFDIENVGSFDLAIPDVSFPQQLGFAIQQKVSRRSRVHGDIVWTDWSAAFDGWSAQVAGSDEGLGVMVGPDGTEVDMGMKWSDTLRVSLGAEYDFFETNFQRGLDGRLKKLQQGFPITFRTGVGISNNPMHESPTIGLTPYNTLHVGMGVTRWDWMGGDVHLGFVTALPEPWESGEHAVLSDLDDDIYRQSHWSVVLGYQTAF
jgi:hypothetical protein